MIDLPIRFILVYNIQKEQPVIIRMEIIPVQQSLQLELSFYFLNTNLTKTIIESFQSNDSNREYFKYLPTIKVYSTNLSLSDCEMLILQLSPYISNQNITFDMIYEFSTKWFKIKATHYHFYLIHNFIKGFISNYMYLQCEYFKSNSNEQNANVAVTNNSQPIVEIKNNNLEEYKDKEIEIIHDNIDLDHLTILNDSLQHCSNNLMKYYISKYIQTYINCETYENDFNILLQQSNNINYILININPLIDINLIALSPSHFNSIQSVINSINLNKMEITDKQRSITNNIIYLVNLYLDNKVDKKILLLPLKILEFLLFIFISKDQNLPINQFSISNHNPLGFHNFYLRWINHYIKLTIDSFASEFDNSRYSTIVFNHPIYSKYDNKIEDLDTLEQLLNKERYLLDVDKTSFINNVFAKVTEDKEKKKIFKATRNNKQVNLILNKPQTIDLIYYISSSNNTSGWLSYKLIESNNKLLNGHKIITPEYEHLLIIATSNNKSLIADTIKSKMNPKLLRFYDTIMNHIFVEIASSMKEMNSISSLYLVNHHIRPFLIDEDNISAETELFILYRTVIPYLYDIYNIDKFIDYFH